MMTTKKTFLVAVPAAALVLGGGIGIGLAATSGPSQTVPKPAGQVLVTPPTAGTAQLTAEQIQAKHQDPHGQPAHTTPASGQQDRSPDRDCDRPGLSTVTPKASVPTTTTQGSGSMHDHGTTHPNGSTSDVDSHDGDAAHHSGSGHGGCDR